MAATFTLEEDLQNEAFKVRELELQVRDLQREIADYKINADPNFKKEVMKLRAAAPGFHRQPQA